MDVYVRREESATSTGCAAFQINNASEAEALVRDLKRGGGFYIVVDGVRSCDIAYQFVIGEDGAAFCEIIVADE